MGGERKGPAVGIASRVAQLYQIKVNALLDRAEDPREMRDYSYVQQQEFLRRMCGAVADVAASRQHAEAEESELRRAELARTREQVAPPASGPPPGKPAVDGRRPACLVSCVVGPMRMEVPK